MKIAIVNDIHVGRALAYFGKVRASSHLIEGKIEPILNHIVKEHSPDLLVNLGDLIRSEEKEIDLSAYARLLGPFSKIEIPVIHLLGNHELKRMTEGEVENAWLKRNFIQNSFGSCVVDGIRFIWLGLELNPNDSFKGRLPSKQLNWLQTEIQQSPCPVLIFSHMALDDHDTTGNFFYEALDSKSKKALFLENQKDVRDIIQSFNHVKGVFQAHLHYFNVKLINEVPYVTCPAMGDNICGPQISDNIPEIYTIVNVDSRQLSVKAYSREFCFAGYENTSK